MTEQPTDADVLNIGRVFDRFHTAAAVDRAFLRELVDDPAVVRGEALASRLRRTGDEQGALTAEFLLDTYATGGFRTTAEEDC